MKTSIPFIKLDDCNFSVGVQKISYNFLRRTDTNILFRGLPTEADFFIITGHYGIDRIVIDLDICKFVVAYSENQFFLSHEYSFIEGPTGFLVSHFIDNRVWSRSFEESIDLIKDMVNENITELEQTLTFAKRAIN